MENKMAINLLEIRKIIESDWDDEAIKLKIGDYVINKLSAEDKEIAALMDIKFIKEANMAINVPHGGRYARCCRGRE